MAYMFVMLRRPGCQMVSPARWMGQVLARARAPVARLPTVESLSSWMTSHPTHYGPITVIWRSSTTCGLAGQRRSLTANGEYSVRSLYTSARWHVQTGCIPISFAPLHIPPLRCSLSTVSHRRRKLLEICDDRYQRRSLILTSQVPVAHWHEQIGDPTIADSILDRIVHNAHRVELSGESMRKKKSRKPEDGGEE